MNANTVQTKMWIGPKISQNKDRAKNKVRIKIEPRISQNKDRAKNRSE